MRRIHPSEPPVSVAMLAFLAAADGLVAVAGGLGRIGIALPVGVLLLVVGALHLVVAYGLWEMESYAYPLGMGVFGVGVVTDLVAADPVSAVMTGFNMYLLYRYRGLFR